MNRDSVNQHCKNMLRKILVDWGAFSEEDIANMQKRIEDEEWIVSTETKIRKQRIKRDS